MNIKLLWTGTSGLFTLDNSISKFLFVLNFLEYINLHASDAENISTQKIFWITNETVIAFTVLC